MACRPAIAMATSERPLVNRFTPNMRPTAHSAVLGKPAQSSPASNSETAPLATTQAHRGSDRIRTPITTSTIPSARK